MMEKINYCIRLTELKQILMEPDKTYVLKLIKYLGYIKQESLEIRYITALILIKNKQQNHFRNTKENDIRNTIN